MQPLDSPIWEDESDKPPKLSTAQVFLMIWRKPQQVFAFIHAHQFNQYFFIPLLGAVLYYTIQFSANYQLSLRSLVRASIWLGIEWTGFALLALLFSKIFGSTATWKDYLRVYAYAYLPKMVYGFLALPLIYLILEYYQLKGIDPKLWPPDDHLILWILQILSWGYGIRLSIAATDALQDKPNGAGVFILILSTIILYMVVFLALLFLPRYLNNIFAAVFPWNF